ncbi:MAG TPA: M13 family metallopeptidase [Bryobacteraceae bacterium]|nr:M13 family metallopeptidase [Bryobacteraceae bacterium]
MRTALVTLGLAASAAFAQKAPGFDPTAIDRSANACVDFYQYACGGWIAANPIPADQSRWGRFDALQERNREILRQILEKASATSAGRNSIDQKIGDYYAACMDEGAINARGTAPLKADLERIAAIQDRAAVTDVMVQLYRAGASPFFRFGPTQDAKNSSQMIADLDQGGLGLPDRDYYLKTDEKSAELRRQYLAHVQKMFELMGVATGEAARRAQAVLAIETELAKGSLDRVARRDPEKLYHIMMLRDVESATPSFGWAKFFQGIGAPRIQRLNVDVPDFLKSVDSVIAKTSVEDLKAYLAWNVAHESSQVLPAAFEEEAFNFYGKTMQGAKEMRPRWKRCVDQTDGQLPDALGRRFVETTLGEEGMRRTQQMVGEIEKAMANDLRSLEWMTAKTKQQAELKLHGVLNKIGTVEKWKTYDTVNVARDDAFGNMERTNIYEVQRELAKIGKPVDKKEWEMSQPTVNAYYEPQQNNINFPAGILQPPFYDNSMDDAVNYGAIGAVIGHELTHAFDDEGRQYDVKGNLRDWWTPADAKAFDQRAACLVDEYGGFTVLDDVKINGKLTLGENTADNGGVRLAYMALTDHLGGQEPAPRDGFTAGQRFFLGFAQVWCEARRPEFSRLRAQTDPHSPGNYRVNGVVSNMPEFQKAFGCSDGQPMVRRPACRVW